MPSSTEGSNSGWLPQRSLLAPEVLKISLGMNLDSLNTKSTVQRYSNLRVLNL